LEIRRAGKTRITNYLRRTGQHARSALESLVDAAVIAAGQQRLSVPGENTAAAIIKDLAAEALTTRSKIAAIDAQLADVLAWPTTLTRPPPSNASSTNPRSAL
jgi:hypothetical protein